ncbi:hypothetical protein L7F22_013953 [Adiantum nelumboides]|nr:hypothetical protein [Adiantum nelumboides]
MKNFKVGGVSLLRPACKDPTSCVRSRGGLVQPVPCLSQSWWLSMRWGPRRRVLFRSLFKLLAEGWSYCTPSRLRPCQGGHDRSRRCVVDCPSSVEYLGPLVLMRFLERVVGGCPALLRSKTSKDFLCYGVDRELTRSSCTGGSTIVFWLLGSVVARGSPKACLPEMIQDFVEFRQTLRMSN